MYAIRSYYARGDDRDLGRAAGGAPRDDRGEVDEKLPEAAHLGEDAEEHEVEDIGGHHAHRDAVVV